jgi:hypothetical protein
MFLRIYEKSRKIVASTSFVVQTFLIIYVSKVHNQALLFNYSAKLLMYLVFQFREIEKSCFQFAIVLRDMESLGIFKFDFENTEI